MRLAGVLGLGLARAGSVFNAIAGSTLLDGLVSYWNLDEVSGTRADSVGDNDLTDNNTVGYDTGVNGNAASFVAANNEYLSVAFTTSDIQSYSAWVKPAAEQNSGYIFFLTNPANGDYSTAEVLVQFQSYGQEVQLYSHGLTPTGVTKTGLDQSSSWHHIIVIHDRTAATLAMYFDGAAVGASPVSYTGTVIEAVQLRLGSTSYSGLIDEVAIWSRVLTEDERTELYNAGAGVYYNGSDFV